VRWLAVWTTCPAVELQVAAGDVPVRGGQIKQQVAHRRAGAQHLRAGDGRRAAAKGADVVGNAGGVGGDHRHLLRGNAQFLRHPLGDLGAHVLADFGLAHVDADGAVLGDVDEWPDVRQRTGVRRRGGVAKFGGGYVRVGIGDEQVPPRKFLGPAATAAPCLAPGQMAGVAPVCSPVRGLLNRRHDARVGARYGQQVVV
jgi:hypothetical protein